MKDKHQREQQIQEEIETVREETSCARKLNFVFAILSLIICVGIFWVPGIFNFDVSNNYFIAYIVMGLAPHFLFALISLYLISRDFKKQIEHSYSEKILCIVVIINVSMFIGQGLVVLLLFTKRSSCTVQDCLGFFVEVILLFLFVTIFADLILITQPMAMNRYSRRLYNCHLKIQMMIQEFEAKANGLSD